MSELSGTYCGRMQLSELNVELEYLAKVSVDYIHHPGRMYLSNGDPGYPPEEEWGDIKVEEIEEVHAYKDDEEIDVLPEWEDLCLKDAKDASVDDCSWEDY